MQLTRLTTGVVRFRIILALALALAAPLAGGATAQGLFSPAILVNDRVISTFDLQQRERFLQLLDAASASEQQARTQLVEETVKLAEARRLGISPDAEAIEEGMAEFAARGDLSTDQFMELLAQNGIEPETFERFVRAGIAWRQVVRARFADRAAPSETEIDRAIAGAGAGAGTNLRVLLSEIILPAPPEGAARAEQQAARIARITSFAEFSEAARALSASRSAEAGGRLDWQEITRYPPQIRSALLSLAPGEVTDPIPIRNGIALLQLRAVEETGYEAPEYAEIDYAAYMIPDGRTEAALEEAQRVRTRVDRCDDLYGVNRDQPADRLRRESMAPAEMPRDIALELAKLDAGEISTALTRTDAAGNPVLMLLMLCSRTPEAVLDTSREDVANQLRNRRIEALADGYLQQLLANARIVEP
ncbi:MAG: peptidylprolyl isomerase [Rhodosalinus sp.]